MPAAFCGTSCITVGPQVVRISPATPSREQTRRETGIPRAQTEHIEALTDEAVRQAPRRA
eukprot:666324-Pyramimonas_sp.AAC.1